MMHGDDLPVDLIVRIRVKPSREKYCSSVFQKNMIVSTYPASTGGAYRDRHGRGKRDAMDAVARTTRRAGAYGKNVWS
jgi:hypothetical protein